MGEDLLNQEGNRRLKYGALNAASLSVKSKVLESRTNIVRRPLGGFPSIRESPKQLRGFEDAIRAYIQKVVNRKVVKYQFWVKHPCVTLNAEGKT